MVSALLSRAVRQNIWHTIEELEVSSPIVREKVASGEVQVVAALYNVENGEVEWLGPHPREVEFLARTQLSEP